MLGALPGPTVVAPPFHDTNGAQPAQNVPIPVTTSAKRGATVLHRGSTGLTPGHTGGLHRARFITVETRMLEKFRKFKVPKKGPFVGTDGRTDRQHR